MAAPPTLESCRGKVVVIHAFQAWCPGCKSRGFPTHRALEEEFAKEKDIVFLHVQTVFEGFSSNTPARGFEIARKLGIRGPILHDARADGFRVSEAMRTFRTGGTPWSIVIDRKGRIVLSEFTPALETMRARIRGALEAQ